MADDEVHEVGGDPCDKQEAAESYRKCLSPRSEKKHARGAEQEAKAEHQEGHAHTVAIEDYVSPT